MEQTTLAPRLRFSLLPPASSSLLLASSCPPLPWSRIYSSLPLPSRVPEAGGPCPTVTLAWSKQSQWRRENATHCRPMWHEGKLDRELLGNASSHSRDTMKSGPCLLIVTSNVAFSPLWRKTARGQIQWNLREAELKHWPPLPGYSPNCGLRVPKVIKPFVV